MAPRGSSALAASWGGWASKSTDQKRPSWFSSPSCHPRPRGDSWFARDRILGGSWATMWLHGRGGERQLPYRSRRRSPQTAGRTAHVHLRSPFDRRNRNSYQAARDLAAIPDRGAQPSEGAARGTVSSAPEDGGASLQNVVALASAGSAIRSLAQFPSIASDHASFGAPGSRHGFPHAPVFRPGRASGCPPRLFPAGQMLLYRKRWRSPRRAVDRHPSSIQLQPDFVASPEPRLPGRGAASPRRIAMPG